MGHSFINLFSESINYSCTAYSVIVGLVCTQIFIQQIGKKIARLKMTMVFHSFLFYRKGNTGMKKGNLFSVLDVVGLFHVYIC